MLTETSKLAPLVMLLAGFVHGPPRTAPAPGDDAKVSTVQAGIFADGKTWLLVDHGHVSSVGADQTSRVEEPLPDHVLGLCVIDGHVAALSYSRRAERSWAFLQRSGKEWNEIGDPIVSDKDCFVGLSSDGYRVGILTSRRLIEWTVDAQCIQTLSEDVMQLGAVTVVRATARKFFVGIDLWRRGGQALQIDRTTGLVERIGSAGFTGDGNVYGFAEVPWAPDELAIALGGHAGELVEVRGDQVRSLCEIPFSAELNLGPREWGWKSMPFFDLLPSKGELVALGSNGIYRIGPNGLSDWMALPEFKQVGGYWMSFDLPDLVLVQETTKPPTKRDIPILISR